MDMAEVRSVVMYNVVRSEKTRNMKIGHEIARKHHMVELINLLWRTQVRWPQEFLDDPLTEYYGADELLSEVVSNADRTFLDRMTEVGVRPQSFRWLLESVWGCSRWVQETDDLFTDLYARHGVYLD